MKYVVLIYESPKAFAARSGEDQQNYWGAWKSYAEALRKAGHHAGGSGLDRPETATTVRLRGGERVVQDGPYADTKEQLGGFFILDVPDLETALDWAARCPASADGVLEVRPMMGTCDPLPTGAREIREALAR
jgi:hypothetical protein